MNFFLKHFTSYEHRTNHKLATPQTETCMNGQCRPRLPVGRSTLSRGATWENVNVGRPRSVRLHATSWGQAVLIALLLGIAYAANAADSFPLRPADTSSPQATLQGFIETMDDILRRARDVIASYGESDRLYPSTEERRKLLDALGEVQKAAQFLDVSGIPPVLRDTVIVDRLLQLTEILNRIEMPPIGDISDQEAMARLSPKRWRLPNTEIDIVLIENGPRARDYLVSAATIDRLPEFYNRVKDLPYKPGPAQQLAEVYRSIGHGGSATIYEAFLNSPVGLSYIVPPRWMLNLPEWAKARLASVAAWQWLGLGLGFLIGGLIIFGGNRLACRGADNRQDASRTGWHALPVPLAIILVTGLLVPLLEAVLRIGGDPRVVITYATTGASFLSGAWLAVVASIVLGEAIVASERLTIQSLDNQLIRLGTRLLALWRPSPSWSKAATNWDFRLTPLSQGWLLAVSLLRWRRKAQSQI